jgi:hypothetical protein
MSKKAESKRGAKGKYDDERVKNILDVIRAGNYNVIAARAAGINPDTFYEWMKTRPDFSDAVKKAQAEGECRNVTIIAQAAQKQWQAAAWNLERKYPERWGQRQKIEHSGKIAHSSEAQAYTKEQREILARIELDVARRLNGKGKEKN